MSGGAEDRERRPPAWAESVLRALLPPRDRDTVTGDLLEEYVEVALPSRGSWRADVWYVRQVISFMTANNLVRALVGWTKGEVMLERLWRVTLVCSLLVAAVLLTRFLFDVFDPVDPVERLLAQARDDYSEFNYPRRWIPAAAILAILSGGGLLASWRTGTIGMGALASLAASSVGSVLYVSVVVLVKALSAPDQDPLGGVPASLRYFGNVPTTLVPMLAFLGLAIGTIGGLIGRALHIITPADSHS